MNTVSQPPPPGALTTQPSSPACSSSSHVATTDGLTAAPLPQYDPSTDPQVGDWVLVVPSRWCIVMPTSPQRPTSVSYVHRLNGSILPHNEPPYEFGGSDYYEGICPETGRRLFFNRWDPSISTKDPSVLQRLPELPEWLQDAASTTEQVIETLEETAKRVALRKRQRKEEGLGEDDDDTFGIGKWTRLPL